MLEVEKGMLDKAERMSLRSGHRVTEPHSAESAQESGLEGEQREAFVTTSLLLWHAVHIIQWPGRRVAKHSEPRSGARAAALQLDFLSPIALQRATDLAME